MPIIVALGGRSCNRICRENGLAGILMTREAGRFGENRCGVGRWDRVRNWGAEAGAGGRGRVGEN